ncbi:hypothetical protein GGI07_003462 [Coemansia sp. Benny D115]|nr:hypothetical protein GGI07_003462 [Coemansia sp. Benny D115]
MAVPEITGALSERQDGVESTHLQTGMPRLPPTPTSPSNGTVFGGKQRTMQLSRPSGEAKAGTLPWLSEKGQQSPLTPAVVVTTPTGTPHQRLKLPKRRDMSTERSSSSATVVESIEMEPTSAISFPTFGSAHGSPDQHTLDMGGRGGRSSFNSVADTLREETMAFIGESGTHVRGTRSMSMVRSHIALSASSRTSLTHRLSQSIHQGFGARSSTSPTLPIAARPRFNSTAWSSRAQGGARKAQHNHSISLSTFNEDGGFGEDSTELTIRLSMDASQSRSYRMLLEGDSVLSDLCVLEDEQQRTVSAMQAGFGRKLIGLYFAATWSADCDEFTPVLQGLSAANRNDLVVVHVSADHHPADMARLMAGSGWLCVPWNDRKLRQDLIERMDVSIAELPKLVIIDGATHHVISSSARLDVERRPLTCIREWKKSRAGLSWWNKAQPWWACA